MEEAIPSNSIRQGKPLETGNGMDNSSFVLNLLINRVTQLENEIIKKDAMINFLTNQLLQNNLINLTLMKNQ